MTDVDPVTLVGLSRRSVLTASGALGVSLALPVPLALDPTAQHSGEAPMPFITTADGTQIFYKAFSETDFTDDLKAITVPTLVMHGTDDQIVPIDASARLSAPLLRNAETRIYDGLGHGLCTINPDVVNPDLLSFIRS